MTPESREFIASARKFFAQFKGFFAEIEELEKTDQLVREGEARLVALREEAKLAQESIDQKYRTMEANLASSMQLHDNYVAGRKDEAEEILAKANEQAGRIVSAAREEAAGFANQTEEHRKTIAAHKATIDGLCAEIAAHEDFRDQAKEAANVAKQQHESEKAALRAFRASLPQ